MRYVIFLIINVLLLYNTVFSASHTIQTTHLTSDPFNYVLSDTETTASLQKQEDYLAQDIDHKSSKISLDMIKARIRRFNSPAMLPSKTLDVRMSPELSYNEEKFLKRRMPLIQQKLRNKFGIAQPLKIAFCCGGQGCQAMIGTLGLLQAAQEHHLLDSSLYLIGSSGAAWTISSWIYMFLHNDIGHKPKQSLQDLQTSLEKTLHNPLMTINNLATPPAVDDEVIQEFMANFMKRFGYNQPLSVIDIYGQVIGNFTLKPARLGRLGYVWSFIADRITKGATPLALCSAAYIKPTQHESDTPTYGFFETGPIDAGGTDMGYIPIQYLGSYFEHGQLSAQGLCPEYPLAFFLGIYGANLAFDLSAMYTQIVDEKLRSPHVTVAGQRISFPVKSWIEKLTDIQQNKTHPENVYAYFSNYAQELKSSSMNNQEFFGLTDSSVAMNFPVPLLFDRPRSVDVIFLSDSTSGDIQSFQEIYDYLTSKNISIPDFKNVSAKNLTTISIFNNPTSQNYDAKYPTFIYLPNNLGETNNFNDFEYAATQIDEIIKNAQTSISANIEEINHILEIVGQKRYPHITTKAKKIKPSVKKYQKNNKKTKKA